MLKSARIYFYLLIGSNIVIPTILITLVQECKQYISVNIIYIGLTLVFTIYDFFKHKFNTEYFIQHKYTFLLRSIQCISILFTIISLLYFLTSDAYCTNENDKNVNIGFYFFSSIFALIPTYYIRIYNNINTQVHPEYELKLFTDRLKGKIVEEIIEECSVCLEKDENKLVEIINLDCTHKYHYVCLNNCFLNEIKKCPLCRTVYID